MFALGTLELLIVAFLLLVFILPVLLIAYLISGSRSQESRRERTDDARLIQELHRRLSDMDQRVESLETILLDCGVDSRPGRL